MTQGQPERPSPHSPTLHLENELNLLNAAGAMCASARSADELLAQVTRLIADHVLPDKCGFLLRNRERGTLVPHPSFVITTPNVSFPEMPFPAGLTGRAVRAGQPWRVMDLQPDPKNPGANSASCSELSVPLHLHGEVVGDFRVEGRRLSASGASGERLLITIVDMVGATLERIQDQEQPRASEDRLRRMLEIIPMGVMVHDGERIYYANPMAMRILGADHVDRLHEVTPLEIIAPAWREIVSQRIQTVVQTRGQVPTIEAQLCRLDGTLIDVELNSIWIEFAGRSCIQAHFTDISDRRQAQRDLGLSELRFRELADAIPQIVWIAGPDGGLIHLNAKATEYTGFGRDQLTGWSWDKVIHPEDLEVTVALWKACLQDGLPRDMAFRIRRVDNCFRWHITRQVPVCDSSGAITSWYGTCTDIEDLKRAEASLQDNESRFRLLFEGAADAIFWADADTGLLTHCNQAAERLIGRNRQEIIGQPQSVLHPPEEADRYRQLFRRHAELRSTVPMELEVVRKDGRRIDVAISPSVTVIGGQRVIQGIFRDISDRKQAEQTIRKLSEFRETIIRTAAEGICVCFSTAEYPFVNFSVWNERMTEITGYTMDEINRLGWYQSLYPDSGTQQLAQQRMERMRSGEDLRAEVWEMVRKDGRHRTVSISTSRFELEGDVPAVAALIQDVTNQKQAVESLRNSERSLQLFRALINLTTDAIYVIDPATSRILDVNEEACKVLGYARAELLQLGAIDIEAHLSDHYHWMQHVDEVRAAGSLIVEGTHQRRDGSAFPVEINVRYVTVDQQEYMVAVARDITDRRQADIARQLAIDELRRSEERFSKLFYSSPFSIIVASYPEGKIIEANDAFLRLFEFERGEVIGRTTGELDIWVLPEDRQRMLQSLHTKGAARNMEYLFRSKSGNRLILVMSVEIIRLDGQDYSLAMSVDITDRKAAEAELHKTDELLRAVSQSTPDAVYIKDREGRYLLFNEAASRFAGKPASEVLGHTDLLLFDPQSAGRIMQQDREVMLSGRTGTFEETLTSVEGVCTFLSTKIPYRDQTGDIIGVIGISRDITERKMAEQVIRDNEERLRESDNRLRLAMQATNVGPWDWNVQTGEVNFSPEWKWQFGYASHEISNSFEEWEGRLHPEDRDFVLRLLGDYLEQRRAEYAIEFRMRHRDGSYRWIYTRGEALRDQDGRPIRMYGCHLDITDRKQAEIKLLQRETQLRAVIENATGVAIQWYDCEGRVVLWNPSSETLFGYPAEEALGKRIDELIVQPDEYETYLSMLAEIASTGLPIGPVEKTFRHRSGDSRVCLSTVFRIPGLDGQDWFACIDLDITDRKRMEDTTRHILEAIAPTSGEDYFHALVNHLARVCRMDYAVVGAFEPGGKTVRTIAVSHRGETVPNFTYTLAATPCAKLLNEELCYYPRHLQQHFPENTFLADMCIESCLGVPLKSTTGRVAGLLVLLHQHELPETDQAETLLRVVASQAAAELERGLAETARRNAIHSLQESETFLRLTQEAAHVGSWEWDIGKARFKWSAELARMYGTSLEDFDGTMESALSFCEPESRERFRTFLMELSTGQVAEGVECRVRRRDGTICDLWFVGQVRDDHSSQPSKVLGVAIDITDRRKEEEQRQMLASQLAQAQKLEAIGRLAGGVAHDFNNILTVINGYSQLLEKMMDPADERFGMLQAISEAGSRAATLTQQLLNYSRKQVINRRVLDLNEVVREMENMLRQLIGENIRFSIACHDRPTMVTADAGQIGQVIMNLVVNARDAMPRGGALTVAISHFEADRSLLRTHPGVQPGRFVQLSVSDTGCGIPPELLDRIFEPFFTTKRAGVGTGLGLASVRSIAEDGRGFVSVHSDPNQGTTFRFCLPAIDAEAPKAADNVSTTPRGRETILIVEDEDAVRAVMRRFLEQFGYSVLDASGAAEAIQIAIQHADSIELLITDVIMSELSGRELVEKIRTLWPGMKYLYVSGYSTDEVVRHGVLQAQVAFLQKPFTPDALAVKVRETLDLIPGRQSRKPVPER